MREELVALEHLVFIPPVLSGCRCLRCMGPGSVLLLDPQSCIRDPGSGRSLGPKLKDEVQTSQFPLLYKSLMPLCTQTHACLDFSVPHRSLLGVGSELVYGRSLVSERNLSEAAELARPARQPAQWLQLFWSFYPWPQDSNSREEDLMSLPSSHMVHSGACGNIRPVLRVI